MIETDRVDLSKNRYWFAPSGNQVIRKRAALLYLSNWYRGRFWNSRY